MKLPQNYVPGEGVRKPTGYGGKGQRMLELMGWRKGQGLGPAKDGMREALDTKEKKDTAGIGASQSWDWTAKFWEDSYNSIAGKIQHDHASSSEDDSSSDDDKEDAATALANKRRRSSGAGASTSSSSSSDSDQPSPAKAPSARTKQGSVNRKQGTPEREGVNRVSWRGRAGKLARVAQHEAAEAARLAALLQGGDKQGHGGAQQHGTAAGTGAERSEAGGSKGGGADRGKGVPSKRIVVTLSIPDDPSFKPIAFKPTPLSGWWGAGYFRSVGAMGGVEEEKAEAEKEKEKDAAHKLGFDEDDQAALYMQAHNNQRRGHTGLGQSTRTLKIAGGKWEGSKKTFEEEEEEEEEDGGSKRGREEDIDKEGAVGEKGKKKKKGSKNKERATEDVVAGEAEEESKRKKKKQRKSGQEGAVEEVGDGREEKRGASDMFEAGNGSTIKANGKASKKRATDSQDASVDRSAEGVPDGSEGPKASGQMGKAALKLAKTIIQETPKRRMKIGKLCARLIHQLGGSHEAVSAFLHQKAKKSKLVIEDGYVQLPLLAV
uniref:G-patch domain-containing protein n=1 Tax=Dunaliella tertiolecta TaxID=3047 RepID=A0A7S3R042_DUNTE